MHSAHKDESNVEAPEAGFQASLIALFHAVEAARGPRPEILSAAKTEAASKAE